MHRLLGGGDAAIGRAPDPEDSVAFLAWLGRPVVPERWPAVSPYLYEFWLGRPDMQRHFPDLMRNPAGYLSWLHEHAQDETDIPHQLIPTPAVVEHAAQIPPEPRPVPPGLRGVAYRVLRGVYRGVRRLRR